MLSRKCNFVCGRASITTLISDLNFNDHYEAFGHRTNWELFRAFAILKLCGIPLISDNSLALLQWSRRLLGVRGSRLILKPTFYKQFVGGETNEELRLCMKKVCSEGMRSMLAATMEEDIGDTGRNEIVYDTNCSRILHAIQMAGEEDPLAPMVQLKLSGLLSAPLLVKLSKESREGANKMKMIEAISDALVSNSADSIMQLKIAINDRERNSLFKAVQRLRSIGKAAVDRRMKVLVDAEYTYMNPGLSVLTLSAVSAFNSNYPVFWNTYQCYLKATKKKVADEFHLITKHLGKSFGAKIVRGAYIVQEKAWSRQYGTPDPICDSYNATCQNYDSVLSMLLNNASEKGQLCQFIAATHNEDSIQFAIRKMKELNLDKRNGGVCFGQLYGMCDQVSNTLTKAGYVVYKSIAYGTLEEVLPYLARRAIENRSVMERAKKEKALLFMELKHRLRKAFKKE